MWNQQQILNPLHLDEIFPFANNIFTKDVIIIYPVDALVGGRAQNVANDDPPILCR